MSEILEVAGLSMHQEPRIQAEHPQGLQRLSSSPVGPALQLIKLSSQDWAEGPSGLMSLGDMLSPA
eukprot:3178319-Karenia_brevis.AAC.1